jgi:tetratricopeptide (TPR) repeat protein
MTDIFISYSRIDIEFVYKLHKELTSGKNKDTWADFEDIPPAAKWRSEIAAAIEQADNFVFIISPNSVASKECRQELTHAIEQHKRLIGVVYRDVDPNTVPKALGELNFIFCRSGDDFGNAVESLVTAVETDLEWVKEHTRLLTRAVEWKSRERDSSLLLRGDDLEIAEAWMARSGTKKPPPNELQGQFILASRQEETARQRLEQERAKVAMDSFYRLTYDIREKLKDIPGTDSIRRHFIEGNIKGLSALVEIAPDASAVRELATNYRALAEILWKESELAEAAQAYRHSNEFTQVLVKNNPSEGLYWRDLATSYANLGLLALPSDPAEALDEYTKALEAAEKAAHLDPQWAGMAADLKARVARLRRNKEGS